MHAALLGISLSIPGLFVIQLVFGLALYYGLSWLSYQYFFVWKKDRYFPGEPDPDPAEDVSARKLAFWNLLGNAVLGMALGLFLSAFASTEFQAVQFMPAFVLPQFLLCGLLTPRDAMPGPLAALSDVLPLSYIVDATREVATNPEPWADTWPPLVVIGGFVVASLALGSATLRRRTP